MWWEDFFDAKYIELWGHTATPERTAREATQIWSLAKLAPGSRVLDAPCGYGRISRALAERGAHVVGVDASADQLAEAERRRGDVDVRYMRHDLRQPLGESGFDVALNIFSSLGYGTEDDDVAILRTLTSAVRPGGLVIVDTNHRDLFVAASARGTSRAHRLPDGTLFMEEPVLDAVRGRVETTWYWSGPRGTGTKTASIRVYAISELVVIVERAGLVIDTVSLGLSGDPYKAEPPAMGGRVGIVAHRPA